LTLTVLLTCLGILVYRTPNAVTVHAGQGNDRPPDISIIPQPNSPLLISSVKFDGTSHGQPEITFNITNVSGKSVSAYAIREDVRAGGRTRSSSLLFDLELVDKVLSAGQSVTRADVFAPLAEEPNSLSLSVDYVEFSDGTMWGADSFRSAEQVAGERESARLAISRLTEVLNTKGPSAVVEAVDSGFDSLMPPAGHSARWVEGFNRGGRVMSARLKDAFRRGGASEVERVLRQSSKTRKGGQ
jgi:hypothetical protein